MTSDLLRDTALVLLWLVGVWALIFAALAWGARSGFDRHAAEACALTAPARRPEGGGL